MAKTSTTNKPQVTVIIPVYNAVDYLQRALDSVYVQSFQKFEIIAVNDGSTDDSAEVLKSGAGQHKNFTVIDQPNHGQGFARNRALEKAKGEYVLFLDADDWLESDALRTLVTAAEKSGADAVHCGWKATNPNGVAHRPSYHPSEIFKAAELVGSECDGLLRLADYFSVNNLYRREFLTANDIRFGEGYIYEDNEFMVAVANRAQKITFVDEALYAVHFNDSSSTRVNVKTDKHYKDLMMAIKKSFAVLNPRLPATKAYLASYFLEKFIIYYQRRVPKSYKKVYLRDFVDSLSDKNITIPETAAVSKFLRLCTKLSVFKKRRYVLFGWCVFYKTRIAPLLRD